MYDIHVYIQWTAPGKKTKTKKTPRCLFSPAPRWW